MFLDSLKQITIVAQLHNDAQVTWGLLKECLFVTDDIRMCDRSQNSYFI